MHSDPVFPIARRRLLLGLPLIAPLIGAVARTAFADALPVLSPATHDTLSKIANGYEKGCGGRLGVHLFCPQTGAALSWRGEERFRMCSSFKASLVGCVLSRCDRGEDALTRRIAFSDADFTLPFWAPVAQKNRDAGSLSLAALCAGAVTMSDNVCANMLLRHIGGPAALTRFWRDSGDEISRLDAYEPELNRPSSDPDANTTTPIAMARTLHRLIHGTLLHPQSAALLRSWMIDCTTGTQRLRAGLPPHWIAGDKTGNNGKDIAADIAFASPPDAPGKSVIIAAYTAGGTPNEARFRSVFHDIGTLAPLLLG
ncbi:class A beta-lactamase [Asaia lannensis]|uniref:beta-lactamase n=1 Tax=Asaia lannensis NBRC 102526 TaxID=1307926 RepID=A0ABT1CFF0_9PROT|nr:class A beta-lactamase [Asaia lannensis]MCO6158979.1 class A beta-lactamase [Asaia lannensis NBRC 102526]GBQ96536.1 beta-lactamase class A [Asaia lannensis NBRC 102526]